MLKHLVIQDVVLIERLTLSLTPGLNVFTGETGAGKSIVLDALGLALGARADAGLIRAGATQASVTAEFGGLPSPELLALLEQQGLSLEEDSIILRRVLTKDGKSRAFLNDQPIGVNLLKQIGELVLEIHGQFETQGLLNPATHRGLLDLAAGAAPLRQKLSASYAEWRKAEQAYKDATQSQERARAEEEFLRAAVAELDTLAPDPGETEKLAERRTGLQHREKILEALQTAETSLNGFRGATSALGQAGKAIARVVDKAPGLPDLLASIDRAMNEVAEAGKQLDRHMRDIDAEPDALQRIEERLFALRAVARKHNVQVDGLAALREDLSARLGLLEDQGDRIRALTKAVSEARQTYKKLAEELSAKRHKTANDLVKRVMRELPPLKMDRAQFVADVMTLPEDQWNGEGMDRVAFLIAANPGTAPGPLHKIASGGELSRFMLALKVVLAANNPVSSLVFDEVDAGIGGATASAVGDRLARLAEDVQILVVTHSPQIAARGVNHLRVLKQVNKTEAVTGVETLDWPARIEEIARMLAGAQVTDAARQAAVSLMDADQLDTKKPAKQAKRA